MKKTYLILVFVIAGSFATVNNFGQEEVTDEMILNYKIDDNTFILDGNLDFSTHDFITSHRSLLNISNGDSLLYTGYEVDTITDEELSSYFYRFNFNQYHNGVIYVGTRTSDGQTFAALDILSHEYTHGIIQYTANFTSAYNSTGDYEPAH